jgi:hypothetical protein
MKLFKFEKDWLPITNTCTHLYDDAKPVVIGNKRSDMTRGQNYIRLTTAFILFLNFAIGQTRQGIQFGTFETHKGTGYDWWRLQLNSDSSFVWEDLTMKNFDSTHIICADKGHWKYKDSYIILYEIKNCKNNSLAITHYLPNSRWRFKKNKIYSDDKRFTKRVYLTKIE